MKFTTTSALVALLTTKALAAPTGFGLPALSSGFIGDLVESVTGQAPPSTSSSSSSPAHQSGGDEYVVLFNHSQSGPPGIADVLSRIGLGFDHSDVLRTYNNSYFRGFSAKMQDHCINALLGMEDVASVAASVAISAKAEQRQGSPWGLQRVSSQSTVTGDPSTLDFTYSFSDADLGSGVDIYVVDTGVNAEHLAFGGRATQGWTYDSSLTTDGDGHGTHVAGTAGASTFGVASSANIIGVKVLDDQGSGSTANTIAGIDWIIQQHDAKKNSAGFKGSVMSMSWGLSDVQSNIDQAIRAAVSAGIHSVVAAGNSGADACQFSPSSSAGSRGPAISVGSVGISNAISSFSNTGACTDVYAPGEQVISTWIGGNNIINVDQGTSMATPHVTGVLAYYLESNPQYKTDPAGMKSFILGHASQGVVTGDTQAGDAKLLLSNGVAGMGAKIKRNVSKRGLFERALAAFNGLARRSEWSLSSVGPAMSL